MPPAQMAFPWWPQPSFRTFCGSPQGLPLAILQADALVAVWAKAVAAESPVSAVSAFIDDRMVETKGDRRGEDMLQVLQVTAEFDTLALQRCNPAKCTWLDSESSLDATPMLGDVPIPCVTHVRHLGMYMKTSLDAPLADAAASDKVELLRRFMRQVASAGLSMEEAADVIAALLPKVTWAAPLDRLTDAQLDRLRVELVRATWGPKRATRCRELVLTIVLRGHRCDPWQCQVASILNRLRRLWLSFPDVARAWADLLRAHSEAFPADDTFPHNLAGNLRWALRQLCWSWSGDGFVETDEGSPLSFNTASARWHHELCMSMRRAMWGWAALRRTGMVDLSHGLNLRASTSLLRSSNLPSYSRGVLRSILTGALDSPDRLFRHGRAPSPSCPFCAHSQADLKHW